MLLNNLEYISGLVKTKNLSLAAKSQIHMGKVTGGWLTFYPLFLVGPHCSERNVLLGLQGFAETWLLSSTAPRPAVFLPWSPTVTIPLHGHTRLCFRPSMASVHTSPLLALSSLLFIHWPSIQVPILTQSPLLLKSCPSPKTGASALPGTRAAQRTSVC